MPLEGYWELSMVGSRENASRRDFPWGGFVFVWGKEFVGYWVYLLVTSGRRKREARRENERCSQDDNKKLRRDPRSKIGVTRTSERSFGPR